MVKAFCSSAMIMLLGICSLGATPPPCPGEWDVGIELVFFKPSVDDTYFVTQSSTRTAFPNGKTNNNDFDFQSGFRVFADYGLCWCGRSIEVDYLRLNATQDNTIASDFISATNGDGDFASNFGSYIGSGGSSLNLLYERVDANVVQPLCRLCDVDVSMSFGLEYAFLRLQENYTYANVSAPAFGNISQRSKTWGVGPQLGLGLDYCLESCCFPGNLTLNFLSSASFLAAETSTRERNSINGVSILNVSDSSTWRLIPALHARIGFSYLDSWCWGDYAFSAGYEFSSYVRGTARSFYSDTVASGLRQTDYFNFDVQGLYITLAFRF